MDLGRGCRDRKRRKFQSRHHTLASHGCSGTGTAMATIFVRASMSILLGLICIAAGGTAAQYESYDGRGNNVASDRGAAEQPFCRLQMHAGAIFSLPAQAS